MERPSSTRNILTQSLPGLDPVGIISDTLGSLTCETSYPGTNTLVPETLDEATYPPFRSGTAPEINIPSATSRLDVSSILSKYSLLYPIIEAKIGTTGGDGTGRKPPVASALYHDPLGIHGGREAHLNGAPLGELEHAVPRDNINQSGGAMVRNGRLLPEQVLILF